MIAIKNNGMSIVSTNYWNTEHAGAGYCFLSLNAGAARLLVPDAAMPMLKEMRGAKEVIISRGPWTDHGGREALELMWEDGSDEPFTLYMTAEQCDRLIPAEDQGGGIAVIVYTRGGEKGRWPGRYRIVSALPCLEPWRAQ